MSFSYKDLEVYKLAHRLAVEIHKMPLVELPKFEAFEEARQIRRAAKSISVNLAEGFGRRRYKSEYIRYLVYLLASCDEVNEHLLLLKDTKSLPLERSEYFIANYNDLGRKLNVFISSVERCHRS